MSYTDFDFPHTSLYTSDLREIIANMRKLEDIVKTFVNTEQVKFADPIIWNITSQYAKTTVVLDTEGNAYLSKQAVPAGVQLNNEEYWQEIFNFTDYTRTANQNLTVNEERNTTRATHNYAIDDWLIWNDVLYKVTQAIAIDDTLTVGTNLVHFTVEDFLKAFITYATGLINQYKDDIDASELAYRQQLAQDIANTTASLQAQLNAAIAGATVDSEVINARVAWYNITYTTLKEALDAQFKRLLYRSIYTLNDIGIYEKGSINSSGIDSTYGQASRIRTPLLLAENNIIIKTTSAEIYVTYYDGGANYKSNSGWLTTAFIPQGSIFRIVLTPDHSVSPEYSIAEIFAHYTFENYATETKIVNTEPTQNLFERGSYGSQGTKTTTAANNRIRSKNLLYAERGLRIITTGTARAIINFYDNNGNFIEQTAWNNNSIVPKNSLYTIVISAAPNDTTTYKTEDEVYQMARFTIQSDIVVDNLELISSYTILATASQSNGYLDKSDNTITYPLIPSKNKLLCVKINEGYKLFAQGLGENYNLINGNIFNGFLEGSHSAFIDGELFEYIRLIIRKNDESNLTIADDAGAISAYYGDDFKYADHNIIALCKDGINHSKENYAPVYPPSSLISFKKAFKQGFRGAIIHLQFTSDMQPVVFHNLNINSNALNPDGTEIASTISVQSSTLAQLDQYDFGLRTGYPGTKISRLDDVLNFIKTANFRLFVEPSTNLTNAEEDIFIEYLDKYNLKKTTAYFAGSISIANRYHTKVPEAPIFIYAEDEAAINNIINSISSFECKKYIYTMDDITISDTGLLAMRSAGIELMIQNEQIDYDIDREPEGLNAIIENYPMVSVIVSQIMPANQLVEI